MFPTERWATDRKVAAQLILLEIAADYGYPPPNLGEFLYQEAKQPSPLRQTLIEEVNNGLSGGLTT